MTEKVLAEAQPQIEAAVPMGRVGREGELKGVAVFLASQASGYITGQTIVVDGGGTIAS
jgi:gluconate 5-dehydrogenase